MGWQDGTPIAGNQPAWMSGTPVQHPKPAVVSAGEMIRQVPRQVGLTLRHGAEGLADVADIVAAPVAGTYNTLADLIGTKGEGFRFRENPTRTAAGSFLDLLGVPTPQGPTERVVGDASRLVAGVGGMAGGAKKLASLMSGPASEAVAGFAANPGSQAVSAASAGASGGSVREAGGGPMEQFGASVVGGLTGAGLSMLGEKLYDGINSAIRSFRSTKTGAPEVNVMLTQILDQNGVKLNQVPAEVRAGLVAEVKRSLDTGKPLNPDVVRRIADYGVVGATPTRGTVTLDPAQITQERNIAKIGMNTQDPALQALGRVQNQNNRALIERVNELGAATENANPVIAGSKAIGALKSRDAAREKVVADLYGAYRDAGGENVRVPQTKLTVALGKVMDEMGLESLPPAVQSRLKEFGFLDSKVTRNLTIKEADRFNRLLNEWNPGFGPESRSIGILKSAVNESLLDVPTDGLQTSKALLSAREAHAARMAAQRSGAGVTAAIDDVAPDKFVQTYIIGSGGKSSTAEVEKMLFALKDDPGAKQAIKENIVAYFKTKALGSNPDEIANFSASGFNRALNEFGDLKLKLFFSPDEIAQLKSIGRVAGYETFQPRGSAVNNSNTAGAVAGILDRIASSPIISRIPFGGAAIREPARNWSVQIGQRRALDAKGGIALPSVAEEGTRPTIGQLLAPGLLLSSPRANGRNDEKRN